MKCKKLFSLLAVPAVVLSLLAFSERPAQGQFGGIPAGGMPQIQSMMNHGVNMITGRESLLEGATGFFGTSVGGPSGSILSNISTAIGTARQISGMDYHGNTLRFGEAYQHTWRFRNSQEETESIEAKDWKLSYTDGKTKFVLVLMDGQEREYPIEELDHKDDLEYLCRYLTGKLDELDKESSESKAETDPSGSDESVRSHLEPIIERIDSIANNTEDPEKAKDELRVLLRYLNDELLGVSIGLMTIEPGTEAGQELKLTICGETLTFRWCPPGEFTRQGVVAQETVEKEELYGRDRYGRRITLRTPRMTTVTEDVKAEQRVTLSEGFWILDSEVTRQMYERVTATRMRGTLSNPQYPSTNVTWSDANDFCKRLNEITTKNFALPTEAQWQYACRADGSSVDLDLVAWYEANSGSEDQSVDDRQYRRQYSHPQHDVKTKEPNAWGIYDMLGNVSEWCADWDGTETPAETAVDPTGPETGEKRVVCGGNCTSPAENCVFDYTVGNLPNQKVGTIGFRVILIPDPPKEDTMSETADEETAEETDHLNGFESTDDNAVAPENVNAENEAETESMPKAGNASDTSESADAAGTENEVEKAESGNTGRGKPAI